jgi:Ser/Thr protein kinase RdoA (MazF antagonist)
MNLLGHDLARSAWHDYVAHFPGLQRYLAARPPEELEQVLQSVCRWHAPVRSILRDLPTQWVHNDAHVSNLTWTSSSAGAQPAAWLDLGGSNRGWAVGDLAIALERNTISWLEPAPRLDLTMAKALINGYQEARPLSLPERQVLPNLLVLCQVEFALSEIAYFLEVCQDAAGADLAWTGFVRDRLTWFVTPDGNDALAQLRASLLQETPRS